MSIIDKLSIRICALAVLVPVLKPLARPFAERLLRRYGDA